MASRPLVIGFGEAMIRFAPVQSSVPLPDEDCGMFLRSVGGDELNVCVATAVLNSSEGTPAPAPKWISVLPEGPMGDVVSRAGVNAGVDLSNTLRLPNTEVGIFTVIPEEARVFYQRRNSAFAKHATMLKWPEIFTREKAAHPSIWMHMTGITPMISLETRSAWTAAMEAAHAAAVPVVVDFNHRKQLGTLEELFAVMRPQLTRIRMLILSVGSMVELAQLEGIKDIPSSDLPLADAAWRRLAARLRQAWGLWRLAVCFKTRDSTGLQRRWSAICDGEGIHTTLNAPVFHRPKDECGGGSAWAAGIIDSLSSLPSMPPAADADPMVDVHDSHITQMARHSDLFAALCQETIGDHSHVTREQLDKIESSHTLEQSVNIGMNTIDETAALLCNAGIIAIIRAKNTDAAIERAKELIDLGCRAIEVTLDTPDWRRVLKLTVEHAKTVAHPVVVGVGTVMDDTVADVKDVAAVGGRFALSPIDPLNFIDTCHSLGVLAVPAGLSSNEVWDMHRRGARVIKLFHAGQVTPKILKSMLGVSPLAAMNIAPSGGVSPGNVEEWWDAGACVVGMGSNLAGKDIGCPDAGSDKFKAGRAAWDETGRAAAEQLFQLVAKRFPLKK